MLSDSLPYQFNNSYQLHSNRMLITYSQTKELHPERLKDSRTITKTSRSSPSTQTPLLRLLYAADYRCSSTAVQTTTTNFTLLTVRSYRMSHCRTPAAGAANGAAGTPYTPAARPATCRSPAHTFFHLITFITSEKSYISTSMHKGNTVHLNTEEE